MAALALSLIAPQSSRAQIVIGGDEPDVTVNWGVLDHLGQPPTLPGMLLGHPSGPPASVRSEERAEQKVIYHRAAPPAASGSPGSKHHPKVAQAHKPAAVTTASDKEEVPAPVTRKPAPAPEQSATAEPAAKAPPKPAPAQLPEAALPPPVKAAPATETKPAAPPPPPAIAEVKPQPAPETPAAAPAAPQPAPAAQAPVVAAAPVAAPPAPSQPPAPQPPAAPQIATAVPPPAHTGSAAAAGVYHRGDVLTVLFKPNDSALPDAAQTELTALAQKMSRDESLGLQLVAFAQGDEASTSKARRLSLSRALEVRKVLMDLGVRSTRIEVRALGNKNDSTDSPDRVDAILTVH